MIDALANAIVARLKARFPRFKVDHFPDVPERHPFASATRELLVAYEGSTFGEPQSMDPVYCDRAVEWGVTLLVRSLRGPDGAQTMIEEVRKALMGWRAPQGGQRFMPTGDRFVSEENGVWRFLISFRVTVPSVGETTTLDGPPLKSAEGEGELDEGLAERGAA